MELQAEHTFLIAIDNYRPEWGRVNVGLFARWFAERGAPVAFVTNATPLNAGVREVWPGIPLIRLPVPTTVTPLHHWAFYRFLWRNRNRIGYIWLYSHWRYAPLAALIVKASGGRVLLKLDGQGGVVEGTNALARSPVRHLLRFLSKDGATRASSSPRRGEQARLGLFRRLKRTMLLPARWAVYDLPLALADVVLAETPELATSVGAYDVHGKVLLYPNSFPLEELRRLDQKLGAESGARGRTVVSVGRIAPVKGFHYLLEAYARVPASVRAGWRLRVIGPVDDAVYAERLQRMADQLAIATETEFVPGLYGEELYRVYARAGIFALSPPRTSEAGQSLSNVITEAMAFGCPIVSTAVESIPFQLDNGSAGLLVPPHDPQTFGTTLERLMSDERLRSALGEAARQRAYTHFSLERNIEGVARRLIVEATRLFDKEDSVLDRGLAQSDLAQLESDRSTGRRSL